MTTTGIDRVGGAAEREREMGGRDRVKEAERERGAAERERDGGRDGSERRETE